MTEQTKKNNDAGVVTYIDNRTDIVVRIITDEPLYGFIVTKSQALQLAESLKDLAELIPDEAGGHT